MTLKKKLVLSFIILVFTLGTAIGYFSYQNVKELVLKSKENEMADTINRIDISMNSWVRQVTALAESIKENTMVRQLLEKEEDDKNNIQSVNTDMNHLDEWMVDVAELVEVCSDILLIDTEGNISYSYSDWRMKASGKRVGKEAGVNQERLENCIAWEKNYPEAGRWIGMGSPICQSQEKEIVSLVSVVENGRYDENTDDSETIMGYVVIELNPQLFSALTLNNHSMFQNQYTFITDEKGAIISSNKNITYDWLSKVSENMNSGTRRYEFEWNDKMYFACKQYNGLTGWETCSVVSEGDFFPQIANLRRSISFVVMLAMLAAMAGVYILSSTFTKPIKILSGAMKRVEVGDFEVQIQTEKKDEMGDLIRAFNYMVQEIRKLITVVYQQRLAQKSAELTALQAQINPHFLYNTLDSINWMLIERDEMEISDVVVSLGDILKYSLHGNEELVPFREELHYIESYLCIQKNRLEDRLQVRMEIEEEAMQCEVPRLILQPVVENAVLHGIERKKEGGEICIRADMKVSETDPYSKILSLVVSDNGCGMDSEELERCKALIFNEGTESKSGKRKGIGMWNVYRRIQLLFGEDYGMQIESTKGSGTSVRLILPGQTEIKNTKEAMTDENIDC